MMIRTIKQRLTLLLLLPLLLLHLVTTFASTAVAVGITTNTTTTTTSAAATGNHGRNYYLPRLPITNTTITLSFLSCCYLGNVDEVVGIPWCRIDINLSGEVGAGIPLGEHILRGHLGVPYMEQEEEG